MRTIHNTLTNPDRQMTPLEQYHSKLAECAVAKFLEMDPEEFSQLANGSGDYDVVTPAGLTGDVKSSSLERGDTLYWPVKKNDEFDLRRFDFLAFCNTYRAPLIEFRGWVFKQEFRCCHRVSRGQAVGDKFYEGTMFWDRPLRDPQTLFFPFKEAKETADPLRGSAG